MISAFRQHTTSYFFFHFWRCDKDMLIPIANLLYNVSTNWFPTNIELYFTLIPEGRIIGTFISDKPEMAEG